MLNDASGTYSENLVVPGGVRKAMNPTGKAETLRRTLQTVKASELEGFVTGVAGPSQVVTVVCVRQDDYKCRKAQTVAEVVNGMLQEGLVGPGGPEPGAYNAETAEHRIVKVRQTPRLGVQGITRHNIAWCHMYKHRRPCLHLYATCPTVDLSQPPTQTPNPNPRLTWPSRVTWRRSTRSNACLSC